MRIKKPNQAAPSTTPNPKLPAVRNQSKPAATRGFEYGGLKDGFERAGVSAAAGKLLPAVQNPAKSAETKGFEYGGKQGFEYGGKQGFEYGGRPADAHAFDIEQRKPTEVAAKPLITKKK